MQQLKRGELSKVIRLGAGKYSYLNGSDIEIKSWDEGAHLFIGSFCSIAAGVTVFLGGNHRTDWSTTFPFGHVWREKFPNGVVNGHGHPSTNGHVIIENDVWIGGGSTIMSGIRIGSGSVIAAGSVVVKDVDPYTIVGGNPAVFIKDRFPKDIVQELLEMKWWEKSDENINKIVPLLQQKPTKEILALIRANISE